MKRIVSLLLGVLLLSPGIVAAAAKIAPQESPAPTARPAVPLKLDLNAVSAEELVDVPGIGPRMAQGIIELRTRKGAFKRIEDLLEVSGIKEKKLAAISAYLEVAPHPTAATAPPPASPR